MKEDMTIRVTEDGVSMQGDVSPHTAADLIGILTVEVMHGLVQKNQEDEALAFVFGLGYGIRELLRDINAEEFYLEELEEFTKGEDK